MSKIRILIVDDQTLMRDSLQMILNMEPDLEVVAEAENGDVAYRLVKELEPDLVLMDVEMPVMDGIECTRLIRTNYPSTRVLILSTFMEDEYIIEGLANGACGFLLKDIRSEQLISHIRSAVAGQFMLPSIIAAKLASKLSQTTDINKNALELTSAKTKPTPSFTERDKSIISLMLKGMSNKQIASTLFMTEGTVRNYVSEIYGKLGVGHRAQAILLLKDLDLDRHQ